MTAYRYPRKALVGDYLRAAAGLAVGLGVPASVPPSLPVVLVFGGLAALFAVFAARTVQRHATRVTLTADGICHSAFRTRIMAWGQLEKIKLRYFGTRRQVREGGGFMQLTLRGGRSSLTLDSAIEGFEHIARQAAEAARSNGLELDPASAGNLRSLGLDPGAGSGAPDR